MKKGFIVAKIKFKDRNIFHCIDGSGNAQILLQDEMLAGLMSGKYVNGFICSRGDDEAYVRLADGVVTLEQPCNFNMIKFCSFVPKYLNDRGTVERVRRARQIALKYVSGGASAAGSGVQVGKEASRDTRFKDMLGITDSNYPFTEEKVMDSAEIYGVVKEINVEDFVHRLSVGGGRLIIPSGGNAFRVLLSLLWSKVVGNGRLVPKNENGCLYLRLASNDKNEYAMCFKCEEIPFRERFKWHCMYGRRSGKRGFKLDEWEYWENVSSDCNGVHTYYWHDREEYEDFCKFLCEGSAICGTL